MFDSKRFLQTVTRKPGVYQMFDADGCILYVGKAKNLRNRLSSYFRASGLTAKTMALVQRIDSIEVTVTRSETEALVLEQSLIKSQRPPYNVMLKDDKGYPYIFLSSRDTFPRIAFHRGAKRKKGQYFGPFPNASSVRDSLNFLQKTFRIRSCEDSVFRNRSRPCLQYQIQRCTAPCVGLVSEEEYRRDVRHAEMFLAGKSDKILRELADEMDAAARALEFEKAARLRDQISALRRLQADQVAERSHGDVDVLGVASQGGSCCVHILFVRQGRILGSRSYFPEERLGLSNSELLSAFIPQFYLGSQREVPREILVPEPLEDEGVLQEALKSQSGRDVSIVYRLRGSRATWVAMAGQAAEQNLSSRTAAQQKLQSRFEALQDALGLEQLPERLECFDISHSSGEATVASCVVFDTGGAVKSDYRRFNIENIRPGDDYAAMGQALKRRYTRLSSGEGKFPNILLIDGGKGQVRQAVEVLNQLGIVGVQIVGVAKGTTRKAGFETLHVVSSNKEMVLSADSPALHLIQQVRDEAHRFAITGHRQRRDKKRRESPLEGISGVGPARRRALLRHFGGLQEIRRASVDEIAGVEGISCKLAQEIYSALHNE
ncbi:Excinuclease ABC subunit C [Microbulbifer thermotolerans]|uniref:excinuclease ABC subunit UvrC n=1 Tax=Microbulbifer thermotolerans TaxID=252514 RepID=UPI0008EDDC59|nr:excinuclease ABC subunit UvrC [Microbulbifer thermotolerans]MCX2794904.1 excinuclease ABC subunit UvrC [Microbulbifer thermotolerans]WKT59012.1 excinuclease ABC subunit UvrC [Microbulbifer thermotolerans]SFB87358.1 Excinuclease ABC subunit C [Microbulbifer thermotolerans]